MEQLKRWLNLPRFLAEEQARQAYLLNVFLLAAGLVASAYALFILLFAPERMSRILLLVPIIALALICRYLLLRGYVRQASLIFVTAVWLVVTVAIFTGGGVRAIAYPGYLLTILMGGLLLGTRSGFVLVLLSALSGLGMIYLEQQQMLPPYTEPSSLTIWIIQVLSTLVVAVALYLALDTINEGLRQARQELAERQQMEAALRANEERYRRLVDEAQDAVVTVSPEGKLTSLNPAFEHMTGWPREEWLGKSFMPLIHPDDVDKSQVRGSQLTERRHVPPIEYRLLTQSGEYIDVEVSTTVQVSEGQIAGYLSIVRDITQRKLVEEALRETQKLDSLGLLAGGVAHDFNNLLVALLGQASLALHQLSPESPARRPIEKAIQAAERAADLTRQLLAYSGRGKFIVQSINLNELIQENLHLFSVVIPKHIILRQEFAASLPFIEADTGQMQQVIMNLLLNAAQAIGDAVGTIIIVTETQQVSESDSRYWQNTGQPLSPGHYVTLEIHDTGQGMDETAKTRLFEPFFSTKTKGRGLGLAAVLGIVRGHNGGIRVYSEPGQGTTFKLLFPAAEAEYLPENPEPEQTTITEKGLVLVIDDEALVREAVSDILADLGLEVMTAADGEAGLSLFKEHQAQIRLVLLDLSMPGLSGEDTFRALRAISADVPVILSSGYNELEATRRFAGKGLAGFLQKPYDVETLVSKVQKYL